MRIDAVAGPAGANALRAYRTVAATVTPQPGAPNRTVAAADSVSLSPFAQALQTAATEKPAASDPFRAYRNADGQLSLEAAMEIEALPPALRKAGKLTKEAQSLRAEIGELSSIEPRDEKRIAGLQAEYQGTLSVLAEELKKLGLNDAMKDRDLTVEDVARSGIEGLKNLYAHDMGNAARFAGRTEEAAKARS